MQILTAGKWVDVETEHLFADQYNVETLRIYARDTTRVRDDERLGKKKCLYCGKHSYMSYKCPYCDRTEVEMFPQNRDHLFIVNGGRYLYSATQCMRLEETFPVIELMDGITFECTKVRKNSIYSKLEPNHFFHYKGSIVAVPHSWLRYKHKAIIEKFKDLSHPITRPHFRAFIARMCYLVK